MNKISIVVPCYNEQEVIEVFYKELIKYTAHQKTVVIPNGVERLKCLSQIQEANKEAVDVSGMEALKNLFG